MLMAYFMHSVIKSTYSFPKASSKMLF